MQTSKQQFIKLCLDNNVLKFGEFTLKSGRKSHYFFNAGLFYNNQALIALGDFYADLIHSEIINKNINFDCLYGPAYKGISLAVATAISLQNKYNYSTDVAFNRKEAKTHGEGGNIIGCNVTNKKVLLIDDVITAGTATRESVNILNEHNAKIAAIVIALDRQDPAHNSNYACASDELKEELDLPIYSIARFTDIVEFTKTTAEYNQYAELLK